MPLYEYQCEACGHRFEVIQKYSDPPISVCPKCGGAVRKLFSSPAIQFKGSGFYITDYARAGKAGSESGSGTKADSTGGSGEKKAEASADSKGESKPSTTEGSKTESKSDTKSGSTSSAKPSASKPASD